MEKAIVITSIHGKTPAMEMYEKMDGWHVIVVGDEKSVPIESSDSLTYLSVADQRKLDFAYTEHCPNNHYARKNIGYLYALKEGARQIYDTDDDNLPLADWNDPTDEGLVAAESPTGFANVYAHFSDTFCWPRGFPLDMLHGETTKASSPQKRVTVGVWQSLADGDPDVDAVFRMVFPGTVSFKKKAPLALLPGTYCPFNSQCTFWRRDASPLLYLPSTVTFRYTDILRGYVAQRLLWQQGRVLAFTSPVVRQDRNEHDLMSDFESEVPCQLHAHDVARLLRELTLGSDASDNMRCAYGALRENGIVQPNETNACDAWLSDIESIMR
jgi:hypothetical protein